jgi:hypothetical protein
VTGRARSPYLVRDLAADIGLPVVIAARTGLGTINHTLLTIEAVRAAGLRVCGVVMTPWPADPAPIEISNRSTIAALGDVEVVGLPPTSPARLPEAGGSLPLRPWLGLRAAPPPRRAGQSLGPSSASATSSPAGVSTRSSRNSA